MFFWRASHIPRDLDKYLAKKPTLLWNRCRKYRKERYERKTPCIYPKLQKHFLDLRHLGHGPPDLALVSVFVIPTEVGGATSFLGCRNELLLKHPRTI